MFDIGVLVLRVVVGALFAGHGLQKLFGWFGGPGRRTNATMLASLGYRRPQAMAWVHGLAELGGGVLLATGFLTPVAVAAIIGVMLNAIVTVHARNGLWVQNNGIEYPFVLAVAAAAIALIGPGAYALDSLFGWTLSTSGWAIAAIGGGLVVGLIALVLRRQPERAAEPGGLQTA